MATYSKRDMENTLEENRKSGEPLYKQNFINYLDVLTDDENRPCIDFIAEKILKDKDSYLNIKEIVRESSYDSSHNGVTDNDKSPHHAEVLIAKRLFNKEFSKTVGKIIDYEVPLKDTNEDKGVGKIDLLAFNKETSTLSIIELKKEDSSETLLRCILEIESYSRYVSEDKLKNDFNCSSSSLVKAILIFDKSEPMKPFNDRDKYKYIFKLLDELDIKVYKIDSDESSISKVY